jgi:hypothetical protein
VSPNILKQLHMSQSRAVAVIQQNIDDYFAENSTLELGVMLAGSLFT